MVAPPMGAVEAKPRDPKLLCRSGSVASLLRGQIIEKLGCDEETMLIETKGKLLTALQLVQQQRRQSKRHGGSEQ